MSMPQPKPKSFAFSYSKLKNFETCPARYYNVDVLKRFKEDEGEALLWGNELHDAFDKRLSKNEPLPPTLQRYSHYLDDIESYRAIPGMDIRTELKLSFARDFHASGYFDNVTWFRCKVDVLALYRPARKAVAIDWKTGKILEDKSQLALAAQAVFSNYPDIDEVESTYVWIGQDAKTESTYHRDGMVPVWNNLWPRITELENAHATGEFPEKPSGLCKRYCPVASCQYHGKGSR